MQNFIHFSALNLQLCEEFHSCGKDVIDRTNTVRQYIHDSESLIHQGAIHLWTGSLKNPILLSDSHENPKKS